MIKKKKTPVPATSFPPEKIIRKQPSRSKISQKEVDSSVQFPEYYGEETIGGHMPNPEADDDAYASIQEWGFDLDTNGQHPKEINLEKNLNRAEKTRRRRRNTA